MVKIIAQEQKETPTLPDESILNLLVEKTRIEEKQGRNGPWEKIDFTFKIVGIQAVGGGGDPSAYDGLVGENIWGSVPFRLTDHPENKLKLWSEAILQMPIGEGFELDTDYYNGRYCRGVTSTFEKTRSGLNPATGQPFIGHQVSALLPPGPALPQQAPTGQNGFSFANPPQPVAQQQQQQPVQQPQQPQQPWSPGPQDPWAAAQAAQPQQPTQPQTQQGTLLDDEPPF